MYYVWTGSKEELNDDKGNLVGTAEHRTVAAQTAILYLHKSDADQVVVIGEDGKMVWAGSACTDHYHYTLDGITADERPYETYATLWDLREAGQEGLN